MHQPARFLRKHVLASACFGLAFVVAPVYAQTQIGTVVAADAKVQGSVVMSASGAGVTSGSSVTAGANTAELKLVRGGEVRICPHSSISLANSQSGRDLVFGMNAGVIETNYRLGSNADTIMTPDFRILLAGPGTFHFAVGADPRGNTCVRSLENSTASILITEQMGDGVYQVGPGEQAYFRGGSVANVSKNVPPDCGCPTPVPAITTQAPAPSAAPGNTLPPAPPAPPPVPVTTPPQPAEPAKLPANSAEAVLLQLGTPKAAPPNPLITSPDNQVHVQVDVPFVFRGDQPADVPPPPTVARLQLAATPPPLMEDITVLPPPPAVATKPERPQKQVKATAAPKPAYRKVFGHIKSFFASMFR